MDYPYSLDTSSMVGLELGTSSTGVSNIIGTTNVYRQAVGTGPRGLHNVDDDVFTGPCWYENRSKSGIMPDLDDDSLDAIANHKICPLRVHPGTPGPPPEQQTPGSVRNRSIKPEEAVPDFPGSVPTSVHLAGQHHVPSIDPVVPELDEQLENPDEAVSACDLASRAALPGPSVNANIDLVENPQDAASPAMVVKRFPRDTPPPPPPGPGRYDAPITPREMSDVVLPLPRNKEAQSADIFCSVARQLPMHSGQAPSTRAPRRGDSMQDRPPETSSQGPSQEDLVRTFLPHDKKPPYYPSLPNNANDRAAGIVSDKGGAWSRSSTVTASSPVQAHPQHNPGASSPSASGGATGSANSNGRAGKAGQGGRNSGGTTGSTGSAQGPSASQRAQTAGASSAPAGFSVHRGRVSKRSRISLSGPGADQIIAGQNGQQNRGGHGARRDRARHSEQHNQATHGVQRSRAGQSAQHSQPLQGAQQNQAEQQDVPGFPGSAELFQFSGLELVNQISAFPMPPLISTDTFRLPEDVARNLRTRQHRTKEEKDALMQRIIEAIEEFAEAVAKDRCKHRLDLYRALSKRLPKDGLSQAHKGKVGSRRSAEKDRIRKKTVSVLWSKLFSDLAL